MTGCDYHKRHGVPQPLTVEGHHIIPQAFQHFAPTPTTADPAAVPATVNGYPLWDGRLAMICPSGHRNTHVWLVKMVHLTTGPAGEDVEALAVAAGAGRGRRRSPEASLAMLGLTRWQAAGFTVGQLAAAKLYGEA